MVVGRPLFPTQVIVHRPFNHSAFFVVVVLDVIDGLPDGSW